MPAALGPAGGRLRRPPSARRRRQTTELARLVSPAYGRAQQPGITSASRQHDPSDSLLTLRAPNLLALTPA